MIDFHTHLLYGIDDGVRSREKSLEALTEYRDAGITHLVFTPHLYNPYVTTNVKAIREVFLDLHEVALGMGIETYLGAELFVQHQELKTIPVLGRYALCEFDVYSQPLGSLGLIDKMLVEESGYEVIIAHVERYSWLEPDSQVANDMKKRGYLFQMNVSSVFGDVEDKVQRWLKSGMIDLFATDNHYRHQGYPKLLVQSYSKYPQIAANMKIIEEGIR